MQEWWITDFGSNAVLNPSDTPHLSAVHTYAARAAARARLQLHDGTRDVKWPIAVPPTRAQALIFKLCSTIAMVKRILVIVSSKSTAQPLTGTMCFLVVSLQAERRLRLTRPSEIRLLR